MQKAVVIAATLHGGVKDVLWVMEADPDAVDVLFLACQRKATSESFGNIPSKDQPTYESLEGYVQQTKSDRDIAWSDRYPELCGWMADYSNRQKARDREAAEDAGLSLGNPIQGGAFNFKR